jgi:hypothetical protein
MKGAAPGSSSAGKAKKAPTAKRPAASGLKRSRPTVASMPEDEDEDSDSDHDESDDDMDWACDVTVMRLLKKAKKRRTSPLSAPTLASPTPAPSKEQIAQHLSEQLHYETDDEESDGEGDESD